MDPTITQAYENGGETILHTENPVDVNTNVQASVITDYTEDNYAAEPPTTDLQVGADNYKVQQQPSMPLVYDDKDNDSLDNVPSEPYYPVEEQKTPADTDGSGCTSSCTTENANLSENGKEQQSFAVVDDFNSCVQENAAISVENQSVSTEQYAESNDNNFVSQYECESAQKSDEIEEKESEPAEMETCQAPGEETATGVAEQENLYIVEEPKEAVSEVDTIKDESVTVQVEEDAISVVKDAIPVVEDATRVAEEENLYIVEEPMEGVSEVDESVTVQVVEDTISVEPPSEMDVVEENSTAQGDVEFETISHTEVTTETYETLGDYTIIEDANTVDISAAAASAEPTPSMASTEEESPPTTTLLTPSKGRKNRRANEIPMHLLGVDISKPVDHIPNGRPLPKPRLGVKVPYRNLTSQIISKEELETEIIERSRAKEEATSKRGDLKFARSLTQRLASKIAPASTTATTEKTKRQKRVAAKQREDETTTVEAVGDDIVLEEEQVTDGGGQVGESVGGQEEVAVDESKIQNDDDLLAILEGEGEEMPVLSKEVVDVSENDASNLKMLEREIALQQLQELPHQSPRPRIFKSRLSKTNSSAPILTPQTPPKKPEAAITQKQQKVTPLQAMPEKSHDTRSKSPAKSNPSPPKTNPSPQKTHNQSDIDMPLPKRQHQPIDIKPQVKANMVLKTYSRKRKTSEPTESIDTPPPKKPVVLEESECKQEKMDTSVALPTDVYVTKSSRVIKRKVIWDPDDELPSRSPKTTVVKMTDSKPKTLEEDVENVVGERKSFGDGKVVDKITAKKMVGVGKDVEKKTADKVVAKKSPKIVKAAAKPKRGFSELDKLLMDEGAVKMLYDLKTTDEAGTPSSTRKKKDFISVEKAEKELMKKASQLKNDFVQNTSNSEESSPKTLRKKEAAGFGTVVAVGSSPMKAAVSLERKLSKDSTRSSVHTPPPGSPAYQYSSQSSMLIRRRSSSSISSDDDNMVEGDIITKVTKKKSDTTKSKKFKKIVNEDSKVIDDNVLEGEKMEVVKSSANNKSTKSKYKSFTVKKSGKQVTIDLNYIDEKCFFDLQVLEELTAALTKYSKDKDCNVVSLTSTSKAFCLGLDYSSLVADKEDERLDKATELAGKVRNFLLCLLNFPKILIAGIQGDCVGVAVTMLPLFDMVIASDKATFTTHYSRLGCLPEGGCLLSSYSASVTSGGLATELFYAGQTLTADDALRRGLISKLCWPEKYKDTLRNIVASVAGGSKQCLEATKQHLRSRLLLETETAIRSEESTLIAHWTSAECQQNFAKLCTKLDQ